MKSTVVPSAGLCAFPWCVEHEVVDYGFGTIDQLHFGALHEEHAMRGGVLLAITHNGDAVPGVMLSAPEMDHDLWYSPGELRQFEALILNAADALDKAQTV